MGRRLVALVPLLTVIVVGYLVLVPGRERAIEAARLWGGPTDRLGSWTGWVEAAARAGNETPLAGAAIDVVARVAGGPVRAARVVLDAEGRAEVALDFGAAAKSGFDVEIRRAGTSLAAGRAALDTAGFRARATQRGGYYPVDARGELELAVAPGRGAFAVPFATPLWARVSRAGRAVPGASVTFESEGAALEPARATSDARGFALSTLAPREHVVSLRVRASTAGASAELVTSVSIVPGALFAERRGDRLFVASPIERERAFVTLVNGQGRWFGSDVALRPDGRGGASGEIAFPALAEARLFAVVSSDRGHPSASRVGWPLFDAKDEPPLTFDARDVLLLDGFGAAVRRERKRQLDVRLAALGVGLCGALVSIGLVLVAVRRDGRRLHAHLATQVDAELEQRLAPRAHLGSSLAIALIVLGFLLVAAVAAWRLA